MNKLLVCVALAGSALHAQGTLADYQRSEKFVSRDPIAFEAHVDAAWIEKQDRFVYRRTAPEGSEFLLVDAAKHERTTAFDHEKLAAALSRATGRTHDAKKLPFDRVDLLYDRLRFTLSGAQWTCTLAAYECRASGRRLEVPSPDGKWIAYQKSHNLYVRAAATNEEIRLSYDGEARYDYATALPLLPWMIEAGSMDVDVPPSVRWSPDSKKILAFRIDRRSAREFTVVQSVPKKGLRPVHYTYAYPLPGEVGLSRAEPVIFDIEARKRIEVKTDPLDLLYTGGPNLRWFADSRRAYFLHTMRGYRKVELREIDAVTGDVRVLVDERSETFVDPGMTYFRLLEATPEVLWSSERDGWCHLYLYDAKTGRVKRQVTRGQWVVRDILHIDEKSRQVWFSASGREAGRDPYLVHVYRIGLDDGEPRLLTPENGEHVISFSPSGAYFTDSYSRVDSVPVSVLRTGEDGAVAMELERSNIDALMRTGWKPPEPFQVLAADGKTDLYGVIYRPSNFDRAKKYPVVESIYTGPQAYTTQKVFRARTMMQATAELGFVVVVLDGRGMGKRSKAFHDFSYKNLGGEFRFADHIGAIKQLAARYPYLDVGRVGVFGHSAGGYDAANAILRHPEFYKVAVSSAGNHDHRMDKAWWNELWMGFPVGEHYREQSNVTLAPRLEGKLLLMHGEIDDNVHPSSTLQLVDALIKANKDFDLLIMPGENHGSGGNRYFIRRRWDYFVRHLLGVEPPGNYKLPDPEDTGGNRPSAPVPPL